MKTRRETGRKRSVSSAHCYTSMVDASSQAEAPGAGTRPTLLVSD